MPDPETLERTFEGLRSRAQTKSEVAESFCGIVRERLALSAQEGAKFRQMHQSFAVAKQFLEEQRQKLQTNPEKDENEIQGCIFAIENLDNLIRQVERGRLQTEGAFNALQALEKTLIEESRKAEARLRGLDMQEKRAGHLSSANLPASEEILAMGVGSAKEPMSTPQQRESATHDSRGSSSGLSGGTGSP